VDNVNFPRYLLAQLEIAEFNGAIPNEPAWRFYQVVPTNSRMGR
jgi:hypothetical protein